MTNQASDVLRDNMRDWILSTSATVDVALFTVEPYTDGTGGSEVSGGSYARQSMTFAAGSGPGEAISTTSASFASLPACTVVAAGLFDASDLLFVGPFPSPVIVPSGGTVSFATGAVGWST